MRRVTKITTFSLKTHTFAVKQLFCVLTILYFFNQNAKTTLKNTYRNKCDN